MSMFAQLKQEMRAVVHATFAVDALYATADMLDTVSLSVRFHTKKVNPFGDLDGGGYALVIENADRAIFDVAELEAKGITPVAGAAISFTEYCLDFTLGVRDMKTGPGEQIWTIVR